MWHKSDFEAVIFLVIVAAMVRWPSPGREAARSDRPVFRPARPRRGHCPAVPFPGAPLAVVAAL